MVADSNSWGDKRWWSRAGGW